MKTTPEQAFQKWWIEQEAMDAEATSTVAELAFLAGAKWAIGELDDRMKDAEPMVGDSIPPIAGDA